MVLDLGHNGEVGRGQVLPGHGVVPQDGAQRLLDRRHVPFELEVAEGTERREVAWRDDDRKINRRKKKLKTTLNMLSFGQIYYYYKYKIIK